MTNQNSSHDEHITNIVLNAYAQKVFGEFLVDEEITEIAINKPKEIWTEKRGVWTQHFKETLTLEMLQNFAPPFACFNNTGISDINPIVSGTLETGERVQVVYPPAVPKGTISVTLRKPSKHIFPHQSYIENGYYDALKSSNLCGGISESATTKAHDSFAKNELIALLETENFPRFFEKAVETGKTIVFAGATGSGKTSFMKTLIEYIPLESRIITIEDTAEVKFHKHKNYVHLYYDAAANKDSIVTSTSLLKSCFRMKPDRILLSEIRGAESWDFIKVVASGHSGSMTSIHAGNIEEAIEGIITRCFQNQECRSFTYDILHKMVLQSIDIICHIECKNGKRYISDIYFKDLHQKQIRKAVS